MRVPPSLLPPLHHTQFLNTTALHWTLWVAVSTLYTTVHSSMLYTLHCCTVFTVYIAVHSSLLYTRHCCTLHLVTTTLAPLLHPHTVSQHYSSSEVQYYVRDAFTTLQYSTMPSIHYSAQSVIPSLYYNTAVHYRRAVFPGVHYPVRDGQA